MIKGFKDNKGCWIPLEDIDKGDWGYMREVVLSMAEKELQWRNQPGDIHVTELVRPLRITRLERRHGYYVDPMSMVDLWEGSVAHAELARFNGELREHAIIKRVHEANVVGRVDNYNKGVLRDYKWTKCYTYKMCADDIAKNQPEYYWQLNIYRWLLEQEGYEVKKQELILRLKDWSATSWRNTQPDYPVMKVDVPFADNVEQYLSDRVEAYLLYCNQPDDALPMCSDAERYGKDKEGDWKRCKSYCNVSKFCEAIATNEQFSWEQGYSACKNVVSDEKKLNETLLQCFNVSDPSDLKFRWQWVEIFSYLKGEQHE